MSPMSSQEDLRGTLIVQEAVIPPLNSETVSILLDIDLFCEKDVPQNEDELWQLFEQLRVRKNQIFEGCITDRVRELIN